MELTANLGGLHAPEVYRFGQSVDGTHRTKETQVGNCSEMQQAQKG